MTILLITYLIGLVVTFAFLSFTADAEDWNDYFWVAVGTAIVWPFAWVYILIATIRNLFA